MQNDRDCCDIRVVGLNCSFPFGRADVVAWWEWLNQYILIQNLERFHQCLRVGDDVKSSAHGFMMSKEIGAPGEIRTPDPQIRSLVL